MNIQTNRPGIWPLPDSMSGSRERYELEICEEYKEAVMRLYRGTVRTSAAVLIPDYGERPEGCPVEFWIKATNFYNRVNKYTDDNTSK